ncbi:hypothetical protein IWZ03DRAFT_186201 [Phyllosticta citriasiana]|uniref:RING-type domain-containing protein n=1 Tax=Phyllosticta citriasiana TaxID=595635 RepID=A0ABR1KK87_9PEZI
MFNPYLCDYPAHHRHSPKRTHAEMERSHRENTDASASRHSTSHSHRTSSPLPDSPLSNNHQQHQQQQHQHQQQQHHHQQRRSHPQTSGLHLPPIRTRFAGDGFDYRRPVMSTAAAANSSASNVIDLTSDDDTGTRAVPAASTRATRPPRFPREIIDLCDDDPQPERANSSRQRNRAPSSPEVEVTFSRRVPMEQRAEFDEVTRFFREALQGAQQEQRRGGANGGPPRFLQPPQTNHRTIEQYNQILNERTSVRRGNAAGRSRGERGEGQARQLPLPFLARAIATHDHDDILNVGTRPQIMEGLFNYTDVAFNLGDREPSPATYSAPDAAGPGFTRSPEENEVLVCPNCDSELCAGDEGSLKRQVWIIKGCGHAYCGECTTYRTSTRRKGKDCAGLAATFSRCVVKGCEKKCSNRSHMIQLFL